MNTKYSINKSILIVERDKTGESCYLQVNSIAMTKDFENEGPPSVYRNIFLQTNQFLLKEMSRGN